MLQNAYLLAMIGADTTSDIFAKNWQIPYPFLAAADFHAELATTGDGEGLHPVDP